MFGPFQTMNLLLTAWSVQLIVDNEHPLEFHKLPIAQIFDNFVGGPCLAIGMWTMYVAYRRGHLDEAISELVSSISELHKSHPRQPSP